MNSKFNPFRPGTIVTPGMFSGRINELLTLEKALLQTKNGNPFHFLIHGERGIGKSSLLSYLQFIASGALESISCGKFHFLTVSIELEPTNTYEDIIQKVGAELQRAVASHQQVKELAKGAWEFLKCWEIMGVKYSGTSKETKPHALLETLSHSISQVATNIKEEFDGVLILIDEADKPNVNAHLGEFVKILTERLSKRSCNNVALGVTGLPTVLEKLHKSHESASRIFTVLPLEPLLPDERIDVIRKGLQSANEKNNIQTSILPDAENWIAMFSEGYPHFIQQFGFCAFDSDSDNEISVEDVINGAFAENGAFQQLGVKYFHDQYFNQIDSDEYRLVLHVMSARMDEWIKKSELRKETNLKESTLGNAINALKSRHIIVSRPGTKGEYRLPYKGFAVWIRSYTQAKAAISAQEKPIEP